MPKVTVITPIYADISQKLDWLDELIQSVVAQTLADWEMVIIDDDSPLPLEPIRVKWGAETRVRWFNNVKNFGPAMTRNTAAGIAKLSGNPAIMAVDSDDVLASSTVLEKMYDVWLMDQSKIVYGNLQQYLSIENSGAFERKRIYKMPQYSFDGDSGVMNLKGIIPVTAMHSLSAWEAAGGWKPELAEGLEDVEYWIAAGKAGFCGQKINETIFLYRRQEKSRTFELKHVNKQFSAMQQKIKDMHSDIYQGRFPVGCCGKGGTVQANNALPAAMQSTGSGRIIELEGYDDKDTIWVEYTGPKKARFDILTHGPNTLPSKYTIFGHGDRIQIHKRHEGIFSARSRLGFVTNVQDPRTRRETITKSAPPPQPRIVEVPKPQLSTIRNLDQPVMADEIELQPMPTGNPQMPTDYMKQSSTSVEELNLSPTLTARLGSLVVEEIAKLQPVELAEYPGIGIKRAERIISKAQELIKST